MKKYRPPLPEATNDALTLLLEKCWHDDPDERPSFSEIHAMLVHVKEQGQWTNPHPRSVSCQLNVVSSQIVVERGDAVDFVLLSNLSCDGVLWFSVPTATEVGYPVAAAVWRLLTLGVTIAA